MVLSDVAERVRAGCIRHMTPGRMPVGALPLMVCGLAVGRSLSCPRRIVVVAMWVDVCERCRSASRHQRPDEQHTHNPMDHHFYPDEGPSRCQPAVSGRVRIVGPDTLTVAP